MARTRASISVNPLKLTIAFREGEDLSAVIEQYAYPVRRQTPAPEIGRQSGGRIPANLLKRTRHGCAG